mmetsp:Transcript_54553/g.96993  ORF Transcript_54553/g.96993 Transcript_54553/m.96993 type:complete len:401 (-) Transcript_54553:353-1555(-)
MRLRGERGACSSTMEAPQDSPQGSSGGPLLQQVNLGLHGRDLLLVLFLHLFHLQFAIFHEPPFLHFDDAVHGLDVHLQMVDLIIPLINGQLFLLQQILLLTHLVGLQLSDVLKHLLLDLPRRCVHGLHHLVVVGGCAGVHRHVDRVHRHRPKAIISQAPGAACCRRPSVPRLQPLLQLIDLGLVPDHLLVEPRPLLIEHQVPPLDLVTDNVHLCFLLLGLHLEPLHTVLQLLLTGQGGVHSGLHDGLLPPLVLKLLLQGLHTALQPAHGLQDVLHVIRHSPEATLHLTLNYLLNVLSDFINHVLLNLQLEWHLFAVGDAFRFVLVQGPAEDGVHALGPLPKLGQRPQETIWQLLLGVQDEHLHERLVQQLFCQGRVLLHFVVKVVAVVGQLLHVLITEGA